MRPPPIRQQPRLARIISRELTASQQPYIAVFMASTG